MSAAVEVMRAEGLERVTLRRLAQELDTGPASLYVYFHNVAALRAAIFEEILGTLVLPDRDEPGRWASCVIDALWSYSQLLVAHPSLARSALSSRPSGSNYLAFVDYLLARSKTELCLPDGRAWGVDALLLFATALAAEHSERRRSSQSPRDHLELAATIRNITPADYPAIAAIGEELLMSGSTRARYEWGVRVLLAGFSATPIPHDLRPADAEGEDYDTPHKSRRSQRHPGPARGRSHLPLPATWPRRQVGRGFNVVLQGEGRASCGVPCGRPNANVLPKGGYARCDRSAPIVSSS